MWTRIKNGDPFFFAAVAGSMFALIHTKDLSFWQKAQTSIGGTGAALFLSPPVASSLPTAFEPAVSFLIGVFAMSIIGIVFQVIEQAKSEPIKTFGKIVNIIIDVLLAVRHGIPPQESSIPGNTDNRREEDRQSPPENETSKTGPEK